MRTTLNALVATAFIAMPAAGQSRQVPAPPQTAPIVIAGGVVHTVSGAVHEPGYVVFTDGLITAVGAGDAPAVPNAETIDAGGLHVYPGLISCDTRLGLTETGSIDVTQDHTELGDVRPEVRAAVAVNPDTDLIPVTRANGILTALTMPSGGLISGHAAVLRLDGWTWEDLALVPDAGLLLSWPRTEVIRARWMRRGGGDQRVDIEESLKRVAKLFDDAAAYLRAKAHDGSLRTDQRWEGMRGAIEGAQPLLIRAASKAQIEGAVSFAVARNMRPIILGGRDAVQAAPLLLEHDVPVIISGIHRMPSSRHQAYDAPFTLPARLHEAGVRFAIASGQGGGAHERNLNHNAATAAAYGLPRDAALRAVTLDAARVLGLGDELGSLDQGKRATLIVTSGDPLEITTDVLVAFIDGRRVDLGNRQKSLHLKYREKYRQLGLLPVQ